jgi:hypothetical protein
VAVWGKIRKRAVALVVLVVKHPKLLTDKIKHGTNPGGAYKGNKVFIRQVE